MPFITDVLQFADSHDVGLNLLMALVVECASLLVTPSVCNMDMHSIRLGNLDND
jgi:hypothetical protein